MPPGSVGIYERPGYYCKKVAEEAASYLTTEKPALAFVHFSDPDELGHSKGWMSSAQKHAISHSDQCLGIIYEALEKSGLIDDTLIIVSADHGGHNRVHSGAKKIDREIPWIACGPGVREDFVITEPLVDDGHGGDGAVRARAADSAGARGAAAHRHLRRDARLGDGQVALAAL